MVKLKIKDKSGQLIVRAKFSKEEEISNREIEQFSQKYIRGFLKPYQVKSKVIEYTGPESMTLFEYLKSPVSKYEFFYMMAQIVEATNRLARADLFLNQLMMDMRYVFINKMTREIHFIYLPIVTSHYCVDVLGFIEAIVYSLVPNPTENTEYVAQFMDFIKSLSGFSADAIQSYIATQDQSVATQMKKQNVGQSGFITDKPKDYYDHYKKPNDDATSLLNEDEDNTSLLNEEDDEEGTALLDEEGTTLLDDHDEGTSILLENSVAYQQVHFPCLQRISTNETISINKPVFRFGKEKSYVDYFVSNNNSVSRSHADIITRGTRYFVYDHNSKNNTYINDTMLPVKVEVEIFEGNILTLANEEFVFHI